jgi:hypothetical protein
VATYGATCYECDTSDIPAEVPLTGATPAVGKHQPAIGQEEVPLRRTSYSYHPTPQQQQYLQPSYQQGYAGLRQVYGGGQNYDQQQPYGLAGAPYGQPQQQYQQRYQYTSQYQYRKRRSAGDRKQAKPMHIKVSPKVEPTVSLVKIMPILKAMQKAMHYSMDTGNSTLFHLNNAPDGRGATLHATQFLPSGSKHYIVISGEISGAARENSSVKKILEKVYHDANKFQVKIVVNVEI